MEEINLKDLFTYFMKRIPIILLISIVVASLGLCYTMFLKTPLYHGNVTLILVKKDGEYNQSTTITQNDIVLNQKLVATYTEIIKSRRVLNQVINELKLDYNYSELSSRVSVSSVSDTEIIKISVSDEDKKKSVKIANTIAEVFKEEVTEIYSLENVSIIDRAEVQDSPYNIQVARSTILFLALGLGASIMVFFVIYYFDTSVKSAEEIESRLGVPVIGSVPLLRKKV